MAISLNKVMLIGNLGKDQETRFSTDNSFAITTFSLATSRASKSKDGQWNNETTWHNIVAYNISDYVKEGLRKGKKVYVEGRIQVRQYTDRDGNKRSAFDIIADSIIPLENRGQGSSDNSGFSGPSETMNSVSEPDIAVDKSSDDDLPF